MQKKIEQIYQGDRDQRWGPSSFAQHGEDLFILNLCDLMGIDDPTYLDVGAHHPVRISNTAALYARGCRGTNVEANPILMGAFFDARPEDRNWHGGIGTEEGLMEFFVHHDQDAQNTFDPEESAKHTAGGRPPIRTEMIRVTTLDDLVARLFDGRWPHILTMDIEGWDIAAIAISKMSPDGLWKGPRIICVEVKAEDTSAFVGIMGAKGYQLVTRIISNLIFIQGRDYWDVMSGHRLT